MRRNGVFGEIGGPKAETRDVSSALEAYLAHHVVDLMPERRGNRELAARIERGLIASARSKIDRCNPPLEVEELIIEGGKSVVLFGPNGAGKTTLFDACMDRSNADFDLNEGAGAYIKREGVHEPSRLRIARLDQEELLMGLDNMTAREVIGSVVEHYKREFEVSNEDWLDGNRYDFNLRKQEAGQRIEELRSRIARLFEMEDFMERKTSELSGGERTKLALLTILASEPDVLLLDEPTNHLDLDSIARLMGLFELYKQAGMAVVSVSHVEWFLKSASKDGSIEIEMKDRKRKVVCSGSKYEDFSRKYEAARGAIISRPIEWNRSGEVLTSGELLYETDRTVTIPNSPMVEISVPSVVGGDIAVFLGKNGTGKTKLEEEIANPRSKVINKEKGRQMAHLPQKWPKEIEEGTVGDFFEWVRDFINPHLTISEHRPEGNITPQMFIRGLRTLGFKYDTGRILETPLRRFSGGEQRLLWFAAASMVPGVDALILDEPTNHMDRASMEIVFKAIQDFPGAVILSTHDLRLLERLEKDEKLRTRNIRFEKEDGRTKVVESEESPLATAQKAIQAATKIAGRSKIA